MRVAISTQFTTIRIKNQIYFALALTSTRDVLFYHYTHLITNYKKSEFCLIFVTIACYNLR